jgi:sigma-E factor negative regulatory protein RseA
MMSDASYDDDDKRQRLSELVDGEADAQEAQHLCRAWRDDTELRERWHAYQLIGDVLRSEDLAHPVPRDELFLTALRSRLADEPAVLAPSPQRGAMRPRRPAWLAPAAVAAGFVVVAGVLVLTRVAAPIGDDSSAATLASARAPLRVAASSGPQSEATTEVQALVADGKLIRDARLERYLAAHKQYGGSSAVTVPGVVLRSSATLAPER